MKSYRFDGKGLAHPSVVVVIADDARTARRLAEKWARENSVDQDTLELDYSAAEIVQFPFVAYGWNGDY